MMFFEEEFDLLEAFIGEDPVVIIGAVDPDDAVLIRDTKGVNSRLDGAGVAAVAKAVVAIRSYHAAASQSGPHLTLPLSTKDSRAVLVTLKVEAEGEALMAAEQARALGCL